jgi:mannosyl-glycoprotein endo-beta-N-acetylglucosaminidase
LSWQNRLNSFNLPFFIPSTSFFSNYSVSIRSFSSEPWLTLQPVATRLL